MNSFNNIERTLKKYNQEHILKFYDTLDEKQKVKFINQIHNTDFEKMNLLYKNSMICENVSLNEISLIEYVDKEKLSETEKETYSKIGIEVISKNQLAIVTLAGRSRQQTSGYKDQKVHMN